MKKVILIVFSSILLFACSASKEDFYNLSFEGNIVAVGYDTIDKLSNISKVDEYDYELNKKEEKIINHLVVYLEDLKTRDVLIDDYHLSKGISETCKDLNGVLINNRGNVCALHKIVNNRINAITLYGDILNEDKDKIDRIEVDYFTNEEIN